MDRKPLISICIPTYNRAIFLKQALDSYVNDDAFDDDVEIIISDNCSPDNTEEICKSYVEKYSNISYYRNDKNISNFNFPLVLDKAKGEYVKLMNDNNLIINNGLGYLKTIIKENLHNRTPILFTNGNFFNHNKCDKLICNNFDDLILYLSFFVTAIHVFGAWSEDWKIIQNKTKYSSLKLAQDDWIYQLMERRGNIILCNIPYMEGLNTGAKGGYNWFRVHVVNYYEIMKPYVEKGYISKGILKRERLTYLKIQISKRMLWASTSWIIPNNQKFDFSGRYGIMWSYYKNYSEYWFFIFAFPFRCILYVVKFFLRKILK